jgi:hypothetical protein
MPVITRSMRKNALDRSATKDVNNNLHTNNANANIANAMKYTPEESIFIKKIKDYLEKIEKASNVKERMPFVIDMFKIINRDLQHFLFTNTKKWTKFAIVVYNKTTGFLNDINTISNINSVYYKLVDGRPCEITKARILLKKNLSLLKDRDLSLFDIGELICIERFNIDPIKSRPRRNISKVDYTGMDTIEPESDYDGITNIWTDITIYEDPDYVPN